MAKKGRPYSKESRLKRAAETMIELHTKAGKLCELCYRLGRPELEEVKGELLELEGATFRLVKEIPLGARATTSIDELTAKVREHIRALRKAIRRASELIIEELSKSS